MKKITQYPTTLVAFHIKRGVYTYLEDVHNFQDLLKMRGERLFWHDTDNNDNMLPPRDWWIADEAGNCMVKGRDIFREFGVLDFDGDYDTDLVCYLSCLGKKMNKALLEAFKNGWICKYDPRYKAIKQYLIDEWLLEEDEDND